MTRQVGRARNLNNLAHNLWWKAGRAQKNIHFVEVSQRVLILILRPTKNIHFVEVQQRVNPNFTSYCIGRRSKTDVRSLPRTSTEVEDSRTFQASFSIQVVLQIYEGHLAAFCDRTARFL